MLKERLLQHNKTIFSPVVLERYLAQTNFTGNVPVVTLEHIRDKYLANKLKYKATKEDFKFLKSRIYFELLAVPEEKRKILLDVIKLNIVHDLNGDFKVPVNSYFSNFELEDNNIYIPLNKQIYTEHELNIMKKCVYNVESIYREYLQLNTNEIQPNIYGVIKEISSN